MIFDGILTDTDRIRIERTFRKLLTHDLSGCALTGGFATETHIRRAGRRPVVRLLHDIDFVVSSFDMIPIGLGSDFLIRHVHPADPPAKNLLQCVDPEAGIRVDIFRTHSSVMSRALPLRDGPQLISCPDLTARAARLSWDLATDSVSPKYVRDFQRLLEVVSIEECESVWQDHRKQSSPRTFAAAADGLAELVANRSQFLINPVYSTDVTAVCNRCHNVAGFPLADPKLILSILGYC